MPRRGCGEPHPTTTKEFAADAHDSDSAYRSSSLEVRLIAALRTWIRDPGAVVEDGRSIKGEIEWLLDRYIGECLEYAPEELAGWWSDGVIHLELHGTSASAIKLLGVVWIDASRIAPFEIDVELDPASASSFAKTIFRIGARDEQGRPTLFDYRCHTDHYVANRPRRNREWAMAVELTPPDPPEDKLNPCA